MRIAAFISHPIQYFTPLFREISERPGVELTVFYFSRHGLDARVDPGFGVQFAWDIDLLAGHRHEFLPRQWPTTDEHDYTPRALNTDLLRVLHRGWDAVFVNGYAHVNNWMITALCAGLGIPVLCFGDTNLRTDENKSLPKKLAKRAALAVFFRGVSAFLAAGGQTRDYFMSYGATREQVFICPYAVDVARFRECVAQGGEARTALRRAWGVPETARIAMFCGKLVDWKRPGDLLDAVRRLNRDDVVAVFVGDGVLRTKLEARAGTHGRLVGFVNQRDMPLALSLAHVIVLPSAFEPYGMVVAEAQAVGVPALVSDRCGCHGPDSVLLDGVSGFVFPVGDVTALSEHIRVLLDDHARYATMQSAALDQSATQSQVRAADGFLAAARYAMQRTRNRQQDR